MAVRMTYTYIQTHRDKRLRTHLYVRDRSIATFFDNGIIKMIMHGSQDDVYVYEYIHIYT